MKKRIHLFFILIAILNYHCYSKDTDSSANTNQIVKGYYQTINLDDETPCNCNEKTDRTHELHRGLVEGDVMKYNLFAYSFSLGSSAVPASKLFKAIEDDVSVYKISMKEWQSFMLLTNDKFDSTSFEVAASKVFVNFTKILPEDFLKIKNTTSYNEYMQKLQENTKPVDQQH